MSTRDSTGLHMDRYDEILSNVIDKAIEWLGESLSTDEQELMGHILRQISWQTKTSNEIIQDLYDRLSVSENNGVGLENILELVNIYRQSETKSTATVTCTVSKACTIPAGSLVRTSANVYFATDTELVFIGSGSDDVTVTCTENGPNNAGIGEIVIIVNSVNGWTSVTNAAAAIPGRNEETDAELKLRHLTAVATSGERDAASIAEAIGAVDGVSAVKVLEDYESSLPVSIFVIGGSDADIASAIDGQITIGIGTAGTESVDVYDTTLKQTKNVRFSRATDVNIYIDMVLNVNSYLYPADGEIQIKAALASFFDGNDIGEGVVYNKLYQPIYTVTGITINQLYIGTSPSPSGTSDIDIGNAWRAVLDTANVGISYV